MPTPLAAVRDTFRAMATTFVPEAVRLDEAGWRELEATVERALAQRPATVRRQVMAFMRIVNALPLLRYGRRFTSLDQERRAQLLAALQRAPVLPLRRGVWGVRTLVFMGYYTQPSIMAGIGYRATTRGWDART